MYGPGGENADEGDCDDSDENVRPGAMEDPSDADDNDCDTCVNECEDQDDDGYDNCSPGDLGDPSCTVDTDPVAGVNDGGDDGLEQDCVDATLQFDFQAAVINPGVVFQVANMEGQQVPRSEVCDDRDNDCNGEIDEGYDPSTCDPLF